jgi:ABC-type multidrug transport system fused ATPase/permease subunit
LDNEDLTTIVSLSLSTYIYIARALLQRADVIILDESFAALDPDTMRLSLRCVLNRAPTLLVIAHP